ncbi:hypothetical protein Pedsa_2562 [Pseudopedobacter saltans DSM 12145]|uniref:Adhesin n=1 Tax=Pseudopedobacter saltans (strain ATCC 51119 / DSM 12145 / JCM 21818 / CCUG 39354 / LMG 10337 / NBRC 100064 / NCIMB 13643) TaxID=762903 RepID=F0S4T8_PSESL|nr:DUF5627 domain-containing protein [Pseudopedobacter saltans]ADY53106.1 hypothetical protein Pedsa_2562 [Pseudopedobacter saltans DSM 12145]
MKKRILMLLAGVVCLGSCKNGDWEFDDFEHQSVYFAYQGPVRTITLGEDVFDTSLDNEHKCEIIATMGGVYQNKKDVTVGIQVDNSIAVNKAFNSGGDIIPMPASYYSLASDKIVIPKGKITGGVQVQLTDAFFADPLSLKNTYVIPLKMVNVNNADSILSGKDYTLYAIKYINKWHGNYLRRGKDVVVGKGGNTALNKTIIRHKQYVEEDEISSLKTASLTVAEFPVVFKDENNQNINCKLLLTFDGNGNCAITNGDNTFTATGSGKFVTKGEKNSWGAKDRDALYLNYQIDLPTRNITSTDTLVMRDRGVKMETFTAVSK